MGLFFIVLVPDLYWSALKFNMKILSLLLITALITAGKTCGQSLESITAISFVKQSRGFLDEIVISRDSVQGFMENHRTPESSKEYSTGIDQDQWAALIFSLKDVSLENLDGLQSPTINRAHDGAIHSSLEITFDNGKTISHSFDDENPHPDLKPLLDAILLHRLSTQK